MRCPRRVTLLGISTTPEPFRGSRSEHTRQQLRAQRFRRLGRDVYLLGARPDNVRLRAAAALAALPDAVLSHHSAAALLNLPVAARLGVDLVRPPGAGVSRRRQGVHTHRALLHHEDVVDVGGLPVTSPVRTFLDLAAVLPAVELVVLGDAVACRCGVPALELGVDLAVARRGVVAARSALLRVDPGADSPAETRTRLLLQDAGLTGLRHGVVVRDQQGGWLSRPDLADEDARVAVQYDGLVHLEQGPEQWRADIDRDELTRAAGWEVVVLTARDLRRPDRAVLKVRAAYARAAARDRPS